MDSMLSAVFVLVSLFPFWLPKHYSNNFPHSTFMYMHMFEWRVVLTLLYLVAHYLVACLCMTSKLR